MHQPGSPGAGCRNTEAESASLGSSEHPTNPHRAPEWGHPGPPALCHPPLCVSSSGGTERALGTALGHRVPEEGSRKELQREERSLSPHSCFIFSPWNWGSSPWGPEAFYSGAVCAHPYL